MNSPSRVLLAVAALLAGGCATYSPSSAVARTFLRVPSHYLGNLSVKDRRFFLREIHGSDRIIIGRNLEFSWDGEEPMGGEGPFAFHVFGSAARPTVGIFIERFYDTSTKIPPSTSLYILQRDRAEWTDVTRYVMPQPFDPRLYYQFLPSSDTLQVRAYTHSHAGYIVPGRLLHVWRWDGSKFASSRE